MADLTTKFDRHIEALGKTQSTPEGLVDAAVYVHDTLKVAVVAAQDLFASGQIPLEVVLGIYDRIDVERRRRTEKA